MHGGKKVSNVRSLMLTKEILMLCDAKSDFSNTTCCNVPPPPPPPPLASSEENSSIEGVGVEKLLEVGKLDKLKGGPLFWVDSADSQPCMGQYMCQRLAQQASMEYKIQLKYVIKHNYMCFCLVSKKNTFC